MDWLVYDWTLDGSPAQIFVDMELAREVPDPGRPQMYWLMAERLGARKLFPVFSDDRAFAKLETQCALAMRGYATHVGTVIQAGQMTVYFYGHADAASVLEDFSARKKQFFCECGSHRDPGWNTYLKMLYPDDARLQTVRNLPVIELHIKNGDHISASRKVEHFLYFPSELTRLQFQEDAKKAGFLIVSSEFNQDVDPPHGVTVRFISDLRKSSVDTMTTCLIRLAGLYGGVYKGWDCPIVRGKKHRPFLSNP